MGTHEPGDSGDDRLDDIGRRIDSVRDHDRKPQPAQPSGGLNVVYRMSTEFVAAVFLGLALGWGFDYVTGWKPIGIIGFSILGIAAAFWNVFRAARELNAEQDKKGK